MRNVNLEGEGNHERERDRGIGGGATGCGAGSVQTVLIEAGGRDSAQEYCVHFRSKQVNTRTDDLTIL